MEKILLQNGQIVDGSGGEAYTGSVLIEDGIIIKIGDTEPDDNTRVIDVQNFCIAPGFMIPTATLTWRFW